MNVEIDEAGSDDQSASIEFLIGTATDLVGKGNFRYSSISQQHVHGGIDVCGRIGQVAAFDEEGTRFGFILRHADACGTRGAKAPSLTNRLAQRRSAAPPKICTTRLPCPPQPFETGKRIA